MLFSRAALLAQPAAAPAAMTDAEAGFQPIFDGKTLAGWSTPGNPESWAVEDGKIVCLNKKGDYLRSDRQYANFTLSLEYKIAAGGNSGVGIRTPVGGWPSGDGMEMQIEDRPHNEPLHGQSPMAIYSNVEPIARNDRSNEWNRVVVKAEGRMISAWMNGALVQCVNTAWHPELKHRHLRGWIGFQDHNDHVEYRNVRVLEAPDGLGLDAWYAPRRPWGSELIVDQLMNADDLCRAAPPRLERQTFTNSTTIDGPGAVVGITRTSERGNVRLYFNGHSTAAVDCPAKELRQKLPKLAVDQESLLVYVPFEQSLKIELADAKQTEYTVEYVRFGNEVRIEPFDGPDHTARRGLITAAIYRAFQQSHGSLRKYDPAAKQQSELVTIAPGATVPMLKLDGSGFIEWFRLHASKNVLAANDLWLEVTVDGEATPAVAAPVRHLFPGLAQGKNYRNFVVTSRDGFTQRLAIPYGNGVTLALTNRGKRAVKEVELFVSYEPKPAGDPVLAARLRSQWLDGSQSAPQAREGRIVGLVAATTTSGNDALGALLGLPAKPDELRQALSGRSEGLAWRWWLCGQPKLEHDELVKLNAPALMLFYQPVAAGQ
ncbi:MAG TPA: family 16 glycoside hydrolase [Pirellulales bacterium]|nr:family 16 glycoside hydrolase [Pirellulales bacterium]